jgi:hypothetical protein
LVTSTRDDCGMRKVSQEDLDALNHLLQDGLIEVVRIDEEFGEPSYRLASRFTVEPGLPRPKGVPGVRGKRLWSPSYDVRSVRRRSLCRSPSVAQVQMQPVPSRAPKASKAIP